jgi:dephospho-CoA kinase
VRLIAISGKIGTGKSKLAEHLTSKLPGWVVLSYGKLLKKMCSRLTKIQIRRFYDSKDDVYPMRKNYTILGTTVVPPYPTMTIREILQWIGTDVVRRRYSDYWIGCMRDEIKLAKKNGAKGIVIDDMRFLNEAGLAGFLQGYLVRLEPYPAWTCAKNIAAHESETALDDFDSWNFKFAPAFGNLEAVADLIAHQMGVRCED